MKFLILGFLILISLYFLFKKPNSCIGNCTNIKCGKKDRCGNLCISQKCTTSNFKCINNNCTDVLCAPDCTGKKCGESDGCNGICLCPLGHVCRDGECCAPDCKGKCNNESDGCNGICLCPLGHVCRDGECCAPDCTGKKCGESDGCGKKCHGICSSPFEYCSSDKTCVLKEGSSGGETCGPNIVCPIGYICNRGTCCDINAISPNLPDSNPCKCIPDCTNKRCGEFSGCGLSVCLSGTCPVGQICINGECKDSCTPNCSEKKCGDDGCGGSCGTCDWNKAERCINGQCKVCLPNCVGKMSGDDGCGEMCNPSRCIGTCNAFACERSDGCGGSCGNCIEPLTCIENECRCIVPTIGLGNFQDLGKFENNQQEAQKCLNMYLK